MTSVQDICTQRQLLPHPEGGFYKETIKHVQDSEARPRFTSIEFLLPSGKYSSMHRLDAPEVWYHHSGSTLQITEIEPSGAVHQTQLGPDPGQQLQHLVPPGRWFGARLSKPSPGSYALVGCAVAPGFDWQGFEMGSRADLCKLFPHATEEIHALTAPT